MNITFPAVFRSYFRQIAFRSRKYIPQSSWRPRIIQRSRTLASERLLLAHTFTRVQVTTKDSKPFGSSYFMHWRHLGNQNPDPGVL